VAARYGTRSRSVTTWPCFRRSACSTALLTSTGRGASCRLASQLVDLLGGRTVVSIQAEMSLVSPPAAELSRALLIRCHECDLLQSIGMVPPDTSATCSRCGATLFAYKPHGFERVHTLPGGPASSAHRQCFSVPDLEGAGTIAVELSDLRSHRPVPRGHAGDRCRRCPVRCRLPAAEDPRRLGRRRAAHIRP
jgi:ribosomal protein S27E